MYQIQREPKAAGIEEVYQTKNGITQEDHERGRNRAENEPVDPVRRSVWSHQGELWFPTVSAAGESKGDNGDLFDRDGIQHQQAACQETAKKDQTTVVQERFSLIIKKTE